MEGRSGQDEKAEAEDGEHLGRHRLYHLPWRREEKREVGEGKKETELPRIEESISSLTELLEGNREKQSCEESKDLLPEQLKEGNRGETELSGIEEAPP
jgi:hypothetical protein